MNRSGGESGDWIGPVGVLARELLDALRAYPERFGCLAVAHETEFVGAARLAHVVGSASTCTPMISPVLGNVALNASPDSGDAALTRFGWGGSVVSGQAGA